MRCLCFSISAASSSPARAIIVTAAAILESISSSFILGRLLRLGAAGGEGRAGCTILFTADKPARFGCSVLGNEVSGTTAGRATFLGGADLLHLHGDSEHTMQNSAWFLRAMPAPILAHRLSGRQAIFPTKTSIVSIVTP
jgi:hypothetical protein